KSKGKVLENVTFLSKQIKDLISDVNKVAELLCQMKVFAENLSMFDTEINAKIDKEVNSYKTQQDIMDFDQLTMILEKTEISFQLIHDHTCFIGQNWRTRREKMQKQDDLKNLCTLNAAKALSVYQDCALRFSKWIFLFDEAIKDMVAALRSFRSSTYIVRNDRIVYVEGESIAENVVRGYDTIWAYYYENEKGKISPSSLEANVGIIINCGTFSYAEMPHEFRFITGVTGTLETLAKLEKDVLENVYYVHKKTIMPSVFGRNISRTLLLMDATDSMASLLSAVKDTICTMFERASVILKEKKLCADAFQMQFAVYRDYDCKADGILQSSSWETNPSKLRSFMTNIHARGGDDYEEPIEIGLWHTVQQSEEPYGLSQIILIGDAPAKTSSAIARDRKATGGDSYWGKTKFINPTHYTKEMKKLKEKSIPIRAFYLHDDAKVIFKQIALETGGRCKSLDINSSEEKFSEEKQIKGRTAGQGDQGSYSMILHEQDLEKFHIDQTHIGHILKGKSFIARDINIIADTIHLSKTYHTLYDLLDDKRTELFKVQYEENKKYVEQAKQKHLISQKFLSNLLLENLDEIRKFLIEENREAERKLQSRTVCLMDATVSMSHLLHKCKNTVDIMFERASEILNDHKMKSDSVQIQFAVYRNYNSSHDKLLQSSPWESKPNNLRSFMNTTDVDGGWQNEAIEIGLWHANKENERETIT
ncbi:unnamed protein product, partial [Didymodactylos carnosus]